MLRFVWQKLVQTTIILNTYLYYTDRISVMIGVMFVVDPTILMILIYFWLSHFNQNLRILITNSQKIFQWNFDKSKFFDKEYNLLKFLNYYSFYYYVHILSRCTFY